MIRWMQVLCFAVKSIGTNIKVFVRIYTYAHAPLQPTGMPEAKRSRHFVDAPL